MYGSGDPTYPKFLLPNLNFFLQILKIMTSSHDSSKNYLSFLDFTRNY